MEWHFWGGHVPMTWIATHSSLRSVLSPALIYHRMLARAVFRWGNRSALRRRLTTAPSVVKPIEKKDGIARIASGIVCGASVVYNWHFMGGPDTFGKWFEDYPVLNVIGCALLYPTSRFIAPNNVATAFTGSFFLGVVVILCHPKYNIIPLFGNMIPIRIPRKNILGISRIK